MLAVAKTHLEFEMKERIFDRSDGHANLTAAPLNPNAIEQDTSLRGLYISSRTLATKPNGDSLPTLSSYYFDELPHRRQSLASFTVRLQTPPNRL
jgi:hypothetical protein